MAVETLIATVDTAGGADFSSLSACEADGTLAARNFVTEDIIPVIKCQASGGAADTTGVTFAGWVARDSGHYLIMEGAAGHRHAGVWDTSKYRLSVASATALRWDQTWTRGRYLQIENSAASTTVSFRYQAASQRLETSLVRSGTGSGNGQCISSTASNLSPETINCLVHLRTTGATSAAFVDTGSASGTGFKVYSCTCIGSAAGTCFSTLASPTNTTDARDTIVSGFTNFKSAAGMNAASDYNSTTAASASGGANDRVSQTFTFVDAGSGDYHLDNSDTGAKGHGTDLSALGYTTDIDGTTRGATWDIGFDQITTSGTDVTVNPTGVGGTGSVGSTSVSAGATREATGISATGSVGDETISAGAGALVTGQSSTGSNGTVALSTGSGVSVGGVGAAGGVGSPTVTTGDADADIDAGGQQAGGSVGAPTVTIITPPAPPSGGGHSVYIPSRGLTHRYAEIPVDPPPKPKRKKPAPKVEAPPKKRIPIEAITRAFPEPPKERVDCIVPIVGLSFKIERSKPKLKSSQSIDVKGQSLESHFGITSVITWSPPTAQEIADLVMDDIEALTISMQMADNFDEEDEEEPVNTETDLTIDDPGMKPRKRHVTVLRDSTGAISGLDILEEY